MKTIIVGGFLGSGKTTVLIQFARFLVKRTSSEIRVAILENEIGEVGIDNTLIGGSGFAVRNLFGGCVCCTVSGELTTAVSKIRDELNPEWLIVETTGLAFPKSMVENLSEALGIFARVCIVADAARWARLFLPMNALLCGQIEGANTVLINKTDLAVDIERVENDIREIEPLAEIYRISASAELAERVFVSILGEEKQL